MTKRGKATAGLGGAAAGFIATGIKTAFVVSSFRLLPCRDRYALPPGEIVAELERKAGVRPGEDLHQIAALAAHFAYGTTAGSIYGLLRRRGSCPPVAAGTAFGACVWAGSYLGLLPALRILKPVTHHPARRNVLMFAAHLVWGASLGWVENELSARGDLRKTPAILAGKPRRYPDQAKRPR